jgi:formylglycine-generating enzyme required for sulfatase activity
MDTDKLKLYEFILDHYSLSELKDLCFYLSVVYDDLDGSTRKDKARELVEYMARRRRLDDLRAVLGQQRPEQYGETFAAPVVETFRRNVSPADPTRNPRQVFISHATADAAFAQRLAGDLRALGFAVWIAPQSIRPGEQWVAAINRGLEESGVMVLLLTPAAAASPWVQMETNVAIELERAGEMGFVPLLREKGRYPGLWRAYQWVMGEGTYEAALAALRVRLDGTTADRCWIGDSGPSFTLLTRSPVRPTTRIHEKTGIELVYIPAGPFLYGSADSDQMAHDDEKPRRIVDMWPYWIGRAPVTNDQFVLFVRATGYKTTAEIEGKGIGWAGIRWDWIESADWQHPRGPDSFIASKGDHPVVQVSWRDAQAFCDWAGLALLTEEQWEKAARGRDGRIWPWGNQPPTTEHCNFSSNVSDTTPVGKHSPEGDSPYGCVDMAGNVWEWTASWYTEGKRRALRGGSWGSLAQDTRAAFRYNDLPDLRVDYIGFRVVELLSDPGS